MAGRDFSQELFGASSGSLGGRDFSQELFGTAVQPEPRPEDQSIFRSVADPFLKAGAGVVMGVRMIADAFGAGSETSQALKGAEDWIAALYSAQSQRDSKKVAQIIDAAKDKGVWDQVKAGFSAFLEAPVDIVAQGLGTAAPAILASLATTVVGAPAAVTTAAGLGIGALMGAGTVKGAIYDAVKEELAKTSMPADEIEKRAQLAQEYGGANLDQILMGSAIGGLSARTGLESSIAKAAAARIAGKTAAAEAAEAATRQQVAKETAEAAARGPLLQGARTAAVESGTEFLQGGQEQLARNLALQREGFEVPTFRGVAAQGTLEALAGAPLGGAFGAREAIVARQEQERLDQIRALVNPPPPDPALNADEQTQQLATWYEQSVTPELAGVMAREMTALRSAAEQQATAAGVTLPPLTQAAEGTDQVISVDPERVRMLEDALLANGQKPAIARLRAILLATKEAYDDWFAEQDAEQGGEVKEATAPKPNPLRVEELIDALVEAGVPLEEAKKLALTKATQEAAQGVTNVRGPVTPAGGEGVRVAGKPPAGAPAKGAGVSEAAGVVSPATDAGVPDGRKETAPGTVTPVPPNFRYTITESPSYEGQAPLSVEDADFFLEALIENAKRGRLTEVQFAQSEIGSRLDTTQLMGIYQGFRVDPVGTLEALRAALSTPAAGKETAPGTVETVTSTTGAPSGTEASQTVEAKEKRPAAAAKTAAAKPAATAKPEKPLGVLALADKLATDAFTNLDQYKGADQYQKLENAIRELRFALQTELENRGTKTGAYAPTLARFNKKVAELRKDAASRNPILDPEGMGRSMAYAAFDQRGDFSGLEDAINSYLDNLIDTLNENKSETFTNEVALRAFDDLVKELRKKEKPAPKKRGRPARSSVESVLDFKKLLLRGRGRPALPPEERAARAKARTGVRAQANRDARRLQQAASDLTTKNKERRMEALYNILDIVKTSQSTPRLNQARAMLKANTTEAERAELEKGYGDWKDKQAKDAAFKAAENAQRKRKLTPEQIVEKNQLREQIKAVKFRGSSIYIIEELPDGEIGLVLPIVSIKSGPILTEVNRGRSFLEAKKAEEQLAFELATKNVEGKTEGSTFRMVDKGAYDIQKQRKRQEEKAATASARKAKQTERIKRQREDKINAQKDKIATLGKKLAAFRQNKPVDEAKLLLKEKEYKLEQLRLKVFEEKPIDWDADWEQGTKVRSLEDAAQEIRALQPKRAAKKSMTFEQQIAAARNIESKLKGRDAEEDVGAVVDQVAGASGRRAAEDEVGTDDIAIAGLFDPQVEEGVEEGVEAEQPAGEAKVKKPAGEKKKRKAAAKKPVEEPKQLTPQEQYASLVENLPGAPAFDALSEEAQKQIIDLAERNQLNLAAINRIAADQAPKFSQTPNVDKAAAALAAVLGKAKIKLQNLPQKGDVLTFRTSNRAKHKVVVDRIGEYRNSWAVYGKVYDETGEEITNGIYDVTKVYDKETGTYMESYRNTGLDRFFLSNFKETYELANELNSVSKPSIAELKKAEEAADEARQQQAEDEVYTGPLALIRQRLENTNFQQKLQVQEYAKKLAKEGVINYPVEIDETINDPEYSVEDLKNYIINVSIGDAIVIAIDKRKAELDAASKFSQTANVDKADARFSKFTTAGQAAAHVARTGNAFQRALARRLSGLKILQNTKFVVLEPGDPPPRELKGDPGWGTARGVFIPSTNTIYVRSAADPLQGANNVTVLHEVLHAALQAKIAAGRQRLRAYRDAILRGQPVSGFATEVESLFIDLARIARRAETHFRALEDMPEELLLTVAGTQNERTGKYDIFSNLDEFLSYGMSDPVFQDFLKTVPMEGTTGFSRFVKAILRFLGMASTDQSALSRLIDATDKLIAVPGKFVRSQQAAFAQAAATPTPPTPPAAKVAAKAKTKKQKVDATLQKVLRSHSSSPTFMDGVRQLINERKSDLLLDVLTSKFASFKGSALRQLLPTLQTETLVDWASRLGLKNTEVAWGATKSMQAMQTQMLAEAADISERQVKLQLKDPEMYKLLGVVQDYSTLRRVDPTKVNLNERDAKGKLKYETLKTYWGKLSLEAKQLYEDTRDYYIKNYNLHYDLLNNWITAFDLPGDVSDASTPKGNLIASIRKMQETGRAIDPYFPLMRYGNFWVRIGKGKSGKMYMFESQSDKELFIKTWFREQQAANPNADLNKFREDDVLSDGNDIGSARKDMTKYYDVLKNMFDTIDSMKPTGTTDDFGNKLPELDKVNKERLKDSIYQMILHTLPDASFRKQFIHRQGKEGFSGDLARNFMTLSTAMSNQLSRLKYGPVITNAMQAAEAELKGNPEAARLREFVTEMKMRTDREMNPAPENALGHRAANFANQTAFLYMMTNVKTAVAQLLAIPTFTAPVLASRHGTARTAKALGSFAAIWNSVGVRRENADGSTSWVAPTIAQSKRVKLNPEERQAVQYMIDRGLTENTLAYDLGNRKKMPTEVQNSTFRRGARAAINAMTALFHHSERLIREVTFMASFRLNRQKYPDESFEQIAQRAEKETYDALSNFASSNRPRGIGATAEREVLLDAHKPLGRAILQFKMFPAFVTTYFVRNLYRMLGKGYTKEERKEAAVQFFGTILMSFTLAGVMGIPGFSFALGVLSGLRKVMMDDDEDDPLEKRDLMLWFRNIWLPQTFGNITIAGKPLSDVVDRGVIASLTGFDFTGSMSLNNMWFPELKETATAQAAMQDYLISLMGPFASLISKQLPKAIDFFNQGKLLEGMEQLLPAIARSPVTAYRYATEGASTTWGAEIKPANEFTIGQIIGQSLGFSTEGLVARREDLFRANALRIQIQTQKRKLMDRLDLELREDGNVDKVLEDIFKYNAKNWFDPIRPSEINKSLRTRLERRVTAERGLAVEKKYYPQMMELFDVSGRKLATEAAK